MAPENTTPPLVERFEGLFRDEASLEEQIAFLEEIGDAPPYPSAETLAGFAEALRRRCRRVPSPPPNAVDLCGTGGDRSGTFNVSTVASFVAAGTGIPVAKHGNRSVSSRCGSSDCLERLGVATSVEPEEAGRLLREIGIAFLFAPLYHPAVARVMPARRALAERGRRTVFNLLGPLVNPAFVRRQVLGVFDPRLVRPMAEALCALGTERALVVHGEGLDEITLSGATRLARLEGGRIREGTLHPEEAGLEPCAPADLAGGAGGGDAGENARIALGILEGAIRGPARDMVLLNAAAAIQVGSAAARPLPECLEAARESLDCGAALAKLRRLGEATRDA